MPESYRLYSDPIDYDSFPEVDLTLDAHWIVVSKAVCAQRHAAAAAAREKGFLAAQPDDKITQPSSIV